MIPYWAGLALFVIGIMVGIMIMILEENDKQ